MTPDALARLHAASFTVPRPWRATEFAELLASPHVFLIALGDGFAMGRAIADEAELLTIAVSPPARRRGLGQKALAGFEAEAAQRGAVRGFLEVAADNDAACALYRAAGWRESGRRPGYYAARSGPDIDALVLAKPLKQA